MSLLSIGLGQTAIFTLGIPYLDDNVGGKDSPVYFCEFQIEKTFNSSLKTNVPIQKAITIGVRILGPVLGFILGSICTRFWIHPLEAPPAGLSPTHPRWLGAWWIGMLVISSLLFLLSFAMCGFPRELQRRKEPVDGAAAAAKLSEFPAALRRLLSNRVLVLRTFSSVFHLLPISGLYTFLPKYLESEFKMAAFEANMVTGLGGILTMGVGIFGSGVYFR